jgi:hypothetical protein
VQFAFRNETEDRVWELEAWCDSTPALHETVKKGFENGFMALSIEYDDGDTMLTFLNTRELEFFRFKEL